MLTPCQIYGLYFFLGMFVMFFIWYFVDRYADRFDDWFRPKLIKALEKIGVIDK